MLKRIVILILLAGILVWLVARAGSYLTVSDPQKADVILVLANGGDPDRYLHAVELVRQGYAPHIVFDVQGTKVYSVSMQDLAQQLADRTLPAQTTVCLTTGDSTYEEMADAKQCIDKVGAKSVLVVTSDFHTRRASEVVKKRLPKHQVSIAATQNEKWFGEPWWQRRRWAKTLFEEYQKLIWWELVDRWHRDAALE